MIITKDHVKVRGNQIRKRNQLKKTTFTQTLFLFILLTTQCNTMSAMEKSIYIPTHTERKLYPCDRCSKSFYSQYCLTRHASIHEEKKLYQCSRCPRSFDRKNSLAVHMSRHKEEGRLYPCPLCFKIFTQKGYLSKHMNTHKKTKVIEETITSLPIIEHVPTQQSNCIPIEFSPFDLEVLPFEGIIQKNLFPTYTP